MDELVWIVVLIGLMGAIGKLLNKGRKRSDSKGQTLRQARMFRESESVFGQTGEMETLKKDDEVYKPYEREEYATNSWETTSPYVRETQESYERKERKPYQKHQDHKNNPFSNLTNEQLREGIILAEVLSEKPRSMNPHPAIARYKRRTKG